MKIFIKILLIFAFSGTVVPCQEQIASADIIEHNCCDNGFQDKEKDNSCSQFCQCSNSITPIYITSADLSLDVIFIHNQINVKQYIEGQTEPVFQPPEA